MMMATGLDWRVSLAQECWFYLRTCKNWRDVVEARLGRASLNRFEMRRGVVVNFSGPPPFQIFQEVWRKRIYTRHYPFGQGTPRTIVDVGANIGFFSLYAAQRWPTAEILAYEPAPENFRELEENIRESHKSQIVAYPIAVAGMIGRATLYLKQDSGWHSLMAGDADSEVAVATTTLGEVLAQAGVPVIDLLKIDCEGAEYEILSGQEDLLARSVRFVAMEFHESAAHRVGELETILRGAGFEICVNPEPHWNTGMLYGTNIAFADAAR